MTANAEDVLFETRGAVAIITLNRPQQRNAMNTEMTAALHAAISRVESDRNLRVTILAANGPVFSAGMDLKAFLTGEAEQILFGDGRFGGFVSQPRSKPVIACVQGPALAGGFELVLACDLVVAAREAVFGLPESRLGLVAGGGGAIRVGRRLPPVIANEILLLGDRFDAEQALRWGLINRVTDAPPMTECLQMAERIAANAPLSIAASLDLVRASDEADMDRLWQQNDRQLRDLIASDDAAEGARAFAEKRQPVWRAQEE
ncbi:crotonase/enoyl-CoA hydratase family protein [Paracoccus xiamenensis]|uniref:crotonase/enoyl-CoA hydratase family protein n=1 Tax=Paracoccus xiamenensis TaxID=2714901 RepID=UPI00140DCED4|nr:crotonase/enoyl-CoA hydratase family protein [Paracoccus xiamenensis]NHF71977.1 crotonase/enoyl-CoA hydratase family protein [Paracoccus xiamenensis]